MQNFVWELENEMEELERSYKHSGIKQAEQVYRGSFPEWCL